ncbi:sulfotransferase family 2 domain-containing protein [Oculatella sp. LEGE 06141]|uniref:sulfotransferase family 2 domain-containing protein n=1 Tax=Oculatella sp. LEGE 06141 TaxID=1828648 RepID=UPI00187FF562|nr:sulfotransferase family 2 domain-containing protein [Oculatella sp. LEGE 06141]MBE9177273.1 sulfotransferase family 2 domain-containing protein [Oculatella sp. LEGE 06141]
MNLADGMNIAPLERRLTPADQLCFIHLPKTAGSTFTAILDAQFHVQSICPEPHHVADLYPEAIATPPAELREFLTRFNLVRGHFGYSEIDPVLTQPLYLTMLRDPVDRVISVYEFFKRARERGQAETADYQTLMDATADGLLAFVQHPNPVVRLRTSNFQTRQLSEYAPEWTDCSDAERLASAQHTLNQFVFAGLTERFHESVLLLSYIFGWYPVVEYQNLRVVSKQPRRDGVPATVIDAIATQNQLDLELYQQAKTRFEAQFVEMQQALQTRYPHPPAKPEKSDTASAMLLARLEQHYAHRYAEQHGDRVEAIDFDFRQPLSGMGWHRRNGKFNGLRLDTMGFRWTGPGTLSTLDFPLSPTLDYTLSLHIVRSAAPDILDSLTVSVNDQTIDMARILQDGDLVLLKGVVPQAALVSNRPFVRLCLAVNRTLPLTSVRQGSADARLVGLAIQRIQMFPVAPRPSIGQRFIQKIRHSLFPSR